MIPSVTSNGSIGTEAKAFKVGDFIKNPPHKLFQRMTRGDVTPVRTQMNSGKDDLTKAPRYEITHLDNNAIGSKTPARATDGRNDAERTRRVAAVLNLDGCAGTTA